jgi:hypothetical protein
LGARQHRATRAEGGSSFSSQLALLASIAALTLLFTAHAARADYQGRPDENSSEAYGPLVGDHTYSATLNPGGSDQDWYYFYVPTAGDHLHWTVSNSSSGCTPYGIYYCNVYATLEDSTGNQVGGGSSSAGTSGVGPGKTQYIDWTFSSPGKYYLAVIGDGDRLAYEFSVTPASGVSSTSGSGGGSQQTPPLRLKAHQNRRDVDISLVVPSAGARLDARLTVGTDRSLRTVGRLDRIGLRKETVHYAIKLRSRAWNALKKRHRLTLTLRVTLTLHRRVLRGSQKVVVTRP